MKSITVAAAIIKNDRGEILICQRAKGGSMGGLWEFPGGKLEEGETLEECIVRECREELDIVIEPISIFANTEYQYPDRFIKFTFFNARIQMGKIQRLVHDDIKWVKVEQLRNYEFCPADVDIIKQLNLCV